MDNQEMPDQGQGPQDQPQSQPKGELQNLVEGIHTDLLKFKEVIGGKVDDAVAGRLDDLISEFQELVSDMVNGGGSEEPKAGPPPGPTAGGPGAVPM